MLLWWPVANATCIKTILGLTYKGKGYTPQACVVVQLITGGLLCFLKPSKPCLGGKQLHAVLEVFLKSTQVQRPRVMTLRGTTGPGNP